MAHIWGSPPDLSINLLCIAPFICRGAKFSRKPAVFCILQAKYRNYSIKISSDIEFQRFRANIYIDGLDAWEERNWIGKTININNINFFVSSEIPRCSATNLKPATDIVTINLPNQLKKTYDHINMGIYLLPLQNGVISKNDKIIIHD